MKITKQYITYSSVKKKGKRYDDDREDHKKKNNNERKATKFFDQFGRNQNLSSMKVRNVKIDWPLINY